MSLPRSLLILGLASFAAVGIARAQTVDFNATARATHAENLSRTSDAPTQKDAAVYAGTASAQWHRQIARNLTFIVNGELGAEWVPEFDALDTFQAGARATLSYKFGLGPQAPVLRLGGEATRHEVREEGRSGWKTAATLNLSKRFTDTWRVSLGGEWLEYFAEDEPFDVRNHRITLDTTWDVTDTWQVSAGYSRLSGQLTANASWPIWNQAITGGFGSDVSNYYNSIPWEITNTFGPGWVAYRVDCDADFWWLEVSATLGPNTSLPLRYETVKVINQVDIRYDSEFWSLSIVHRF